MLAQWVSVIVQGGALAILGYHLLVGLPAMLRENAKSQHETVTSLMDMFRQTLAEDRRLNSERSIDDRRAFSERSAAIVEGLTRLRELVPEGLTGRVTELISELQHQTKTLDAAAGSISLQTISTQARRRSASGPTIGTRYASRRCSLPFQ